MKRAKVNNYKTTTQDLKYETTTVQWTTIFETDVRSLLHFTLTCNTLHIALCQVHGQVVYHCIGGEVVQARGEIGAREGQHWRGRGEIRACSRHPGGESTYTRHRRSRHPPKVMGAWTQERGAHDGWASTLLVKHLAGSRVGPVRSTAFPCPTMAPHRNPLLQRSGSCRLQREPIARPPLSARGMLLGEDGIRTFSRKYRYLQKIIE